MHSFLRLVPALSLTVVVGCSLPGALSPSFGAKNTFEAVDQQVSLARLSERHGKMDDARHLYEALLTVVPQNQLVHNRLAVLAGRDKDFKKAEYHFNQAFACGEPTPDLLNDYGYLLYLTGRLDDAETKMREALALNPHSDEAHNNLALILGETGQLDASLAEFRKVVGEAEAHANLAYVQTMSGDVAGAKQQYHQALKLNDGLRPAAEALLQLEGHQLVDASTQITSRRTQQGVNANRTDAPSQEQAWTGSASDRNGKEAQPGAVQPASAYSDTTLPAMLSSWDVTAASNNADNHAHSQPNSTRLAIEPAIYAQPVATGSADR